MRAVTFVVPCYNEAKRLEPALVFALAEPAWAHVLLVDDGSKDDTRALLERVASESGGKVRVLGLDVNQGKAEAVRLGMLEASERTALVGYADADFATPPDELLRLAELADQRDDEAVIGSRVALSGYRIERKASRHYLGRVFATGASLALDAVIYDTQCGAKVFRVTEALKSALSERFISRWLFDVELLGRLINHGGRVHEVPLRQWRDVGGSKLNARSLVRVPFELAMIARDLRARREALAQLASPHELR